MRIAGIQNEGVLEKVDRSFNGDSVTIEIVPMLRTAGNAGV